MPGTAELERLALNEAKPKCVRLGLLALYLPLAWALLMVGFNSLGLGHMREPVPLWSTLAVSVYLALLVWVVSRAGHGRNWARWVVAATTVLSFSTVLTSLEMLLASDAHPLSWVGTLSFTLTVVGTVALFLPAANAYFRASRGPAV